MARLQPDFLDRLQHLRSDFGQPMRVTSGYRTPEHNMRVSKTGPDGPHTTGRAVDIAICGEPALRLIALAVQHGFTGIGVKQHGDHDRRFVHLDDLLEAPGRPRPWIWTY